MHFTLFLRRAFLRHAAPIGIFTALALVYWGEVLLTAGVLLPGAMLRGFAPFGNDLQAPWNILQWDALGQYFPWRFFAAKQLQSGVLPLWNPYQFAGAPFIANGQSAVFYPFHFPFWIASSENGIARAFGVSALLHTLLAGWGTYALLQNWKLSRAASLLGAVAFGFCGYLAAWVVLPTLANTASWLPLCVLLLERATPSSSAGTDWKIVAFLSLALACTLLAGHAQIFFYIGVALFLRALFLPQIARALGALFFACAGCALLGAIQILPILELARNGHRAGSTPGTQGWSFLQERALQFSELPSLFVPAWPRLSFSENFGYVGLGVLLLAVIAIIAFAIRSSKFKAQNSKFKIQNSKCAFALLLALFGLLYATATPIAQAFYFGVPGLSQMGGVGRALVLWSFGAALLAALGLEALRARWSTPAIPLVALLVVFGELFGNSFSAHPTAPIESIYPQTQLTQFLQSKTNADARVLLLTPRKSWLPNEVLQQNGINHPPGVLPPNGAMVYGLHDVAGYDSLASRTYREFLAAGEGSDVSPPLNGNMILPQNVLSLSLDALRVRYVVSRQPLDAPNLREIVRFDHSIVYERVLKRAPQRDGKDFSPGWKNGKYQPESFRLGAFLSLLGLMLIAMIVMASFCSPNPSVSAASQE
jgi:hypothetical protein